jgi:hypothetical protein
MAQMTDFAPQVRYITSITQALQAVITTSVAHEYVSGTIIRIYVPLPWGMQQINLKQAAITVINSTSFSVPIDSIMFDAFAIPVSPEQNAQSVPIGEITSILTAAKDNIAVR